MRGKKGSLLITAGFLFLISAGLLTGYNILDEKQAGQHADKAISQLETLIPAHVPQNSRTVQVNVQLPGLIADSSQTVTMSLPDSARAEPDEITQLPEFEIPDYILNPKMEMPVIRLEDEEYIGWLEIPALGLKLPVMSEWTYPRLKKSPCRYTGTAYQDNLVISAHNYERHFGRLKELDEGARIFFTDADGNRFSYEVVLTETLKPTAIRDMTSGEFDLTLFTCTVGGRSRVTVRCEKVQ